MLFRSMICNGSGAVEILMNKTMAGSIRATDGDRKNGGSTGTLQMPAGEYEVTLRVTEAEKLEIMEMILY